MPIAIPDTSPDGSLNLHATCVAVAGRAVLICGPSGAGKSALALHLMALGADLVVDDRTILHRDSGSLIASAPSPLDGMIEARGIGILNAPASQPSAVHLCVDLGVTETDRLAPPRTVTFLDVMIPLLHGVPYGHFGPAILQYLKHGRHS